MWLWLGFGGVGLGVVCPIQHASLVVEEFVSQMKATSSLVGCPAEDPESCQSAVTSVLEKLRMWVGLVVPLHLSGIRSSVASRIGQVSPTTYKTGSSDALLLVGQNNVPGSAESGGDRDAQPMHL